MADRFKNAADLLCNPFTGVPPLLRQEQGAFVPLGAGAAQEKAVGLQISSYKSSMERSTTY